MLRNAALVVSCALLFGCGVDVEAQNQEIISNLVQAGFPANDIMVADGIVYVGRDTAVTLEASREMLKADQQTEEQYRTTNLVSLSIKKICVNPTSAFNSYSQLSAGLNGAITKYNNLGLIFVLARGPGQSGCNANITAQTMSGVGGSSGFP